MGKKDGSGISRLCNSLNQRVKHGYAPTAGEQKDLEEWRKEKAQLENTSVE